MRVRKGKPTKKPTKILMLYLGRLQSKCANKWPKFGGRHTSQLRTMWLRILPKYGSTGQFDFPSSPSFPSETFWKAHYIFRNLLVSSLNSNRVIFWRRKNGCVEAFFVCERKWMVETKDNFKRIYMRHVKYHQRCKFFHHLFAFAI